MTYDPSRDKLFPRVMFAAPESGSGKTIITCGFLNILRSRGIKTVSFKCGPDYIDPLFHSYITGEKGTNLDTFFLGREGVRSLFSEKFSLEKGPDKKPIGVIEGVMGYFDGLAGTSLTGSSWDIADCLDCPVIMIIDVKKEGPSFEGKLKDLLTYEPQNHIRGVILNRASKEKAEEFRPKARELGLTLYGYIPECPQADIESRHLGLVLPSEHDKFQEKICAFSGIIKETTDIDGIIELAESAGRSEKPDMTDHETVSWRPADIRPSKGKIAVASDEAFCFMYEDNLNFLRELGYELIPFSPLRDTALPDDVTAIILGGGYPEIHAKGLSANEPMLRAINESFGKVKILAECGGFLYLHRTLEGTDGESYKMAGCIDADAYRTDHSSRFGYISLYQNSARPDHAATPQKDDGKGACFIKAHEFHYWDSNAPGSDLLAVKPLSGRSWECMYHSPMLLAGFPHLYYRSGPEFIHSFLEEET